MDIRNWSFEDLPEINRLLNELARSINIPYHGDIQLLQKHFMLTESYRDVYSTHVAVAEGKIVGFVSIVYYSSALHRRGTALINELIVDDRFRGKGIGRDLLQYCINEAKVKGFDEIEVGAEPNNGKAIAFYKQNGIDQEYVLLGKEFDDE